MAKTAVYGRQRREDGAAMKITNVALTLFFWEPTFYGFLIRWA